LEGVIYMQTTSTQTPVRRDGTLLPKAGAIGRWFSLAVNAIGRPQREARSRPLGGLAALPAILSGVYQINRTREAGNPVKVTKDQRMTSYDDLSVKVAP
jgi:hypothetical protein